jgi:hypothetical protein
MKQRISKHIKSCGATRRRVFEEHLMVTVQSYPQADCLRIAMPLDGCMVVSP